MKLAKRATADGVLEKQVEAAVDSDDPKSALVELVMALPEPDAEPDAVGVVVKSTDHALRVELGGLKPTALRKRALSEGIDEGQVDDAMDSDEPKAQLIELLVELSTAVPEGVPPRRR
jgi:hypothetical protein